MSKGGAWDNLPYESQITPPREAESDFFFDSSRLLPQSPRAALLLNTDVSTQPNQLEQQPNTENRVEIFSNFTYDPNSNSGAWGAVVQTPGEDDEVMRGAWCDSTADRLGLFATLLPLEDLVERGEQGHVIAYFNADAPVLRFLSAGEADQRSPHDLFVRSDSDLLKRLWTAYQKLDVEFVPHQDNCLVARAGRIAEIVAKAGLPQIDHRATNMVL